MGRAERIVLFALRMARQLFMNVAKAAAWSSSFQPSSAANDRASTFALRRLQASAGVLAAAINQKITPNLAGKGPPISLMRLLPGLRGKQFPIRIARTYVACECPNIGDVSHAFGVAVNDVAILVACHRYELGLETDSDLRVAPAYFGAGDIGIVDRHKTAFNSFAAFLTFADCAFKTIVYFAAKQILQSAAIALGIGIYDHIVCRLLLEKKMLNVNIGKDGNDSIEPGRNGRAWFGNSLPTFARSIRLLGWLGVFPFCRWIRK